MRLHRLELRAFGPFRDAQVVDFDQLSEAGLFLLTGDTGAGKTSILDAVAYALYGQVPGRRETAMRVRSDHAAPDTATRVCLELSVRGQRLRITRTPDWDRPKKRGTGVTREKGKVLLERHEAGEWSFVSSRHDEAGHELSRLLGMTHEQFCQVVLLPQGDFAAFLSANAEARKHLLEKLFGTERFSAVERWLSTESHSRGDALASARETVSGVLGSLRRLDPDGRYLAPDAHVPGDALVAWGKRVADDLAVRLEAAEAIAGAATDVLSARRVDLAAARDVAEHQRLLSDLQAEHRRLVELEPAIAATKIEIAAARRVRLVEPPLTDVDNASDAVTAAEATHRRALDTLAEHDGAAARYSSAEELRAAERVARDELAQLPAARADELRALQLTDEVAELSREIARHESAARGAAEALTEAPADHLILQSRLAELRASAALLPSRRASASLIDDQLRAARRRDQLSAELDSAASMCGAATERALNAREVALSLYERRLAGIAAELSSTLQPGAGCPVCGSEAHPSPAPAISDRVTDADEIAARARTAAADAARDAADSQRLRLTEQRAAAAVDAGGEHAVDALTARATDAQVAVRESTAALVGVTSAQLDLDALDAETARLIDLATQARTQGAELAGRRDSVARECAGLAQRLVRALAGASSVASRAMSLSALADALAATATALERLASTTSIFVATEQKALTAARRAGFSDVVAAALAVRTDAHVDELQRGVDEHQSVRAVVDAGLIRPELADLPHDLAPVAAAGAAVEVATVAERDARLELGWLRKAAGSAAGLVVELQVAAARVEPLHRAWETVDGLAKLAAGGADNRLRMRLSYYVLSARLEQVAAAASERLLRMSDQRFSLVHTDERAPGNQRSGLGLRVRDGWYATDRDPATLSGGESFMASLALALGLADVVTAEAGGTSMDTLFVDEGFGGLDTETLDAVLDVLDGLRAGGRSVGLVSHVAELRTRIPVQLGVRRAREGSTLAHTG